jgi:hypothetical protein
LAKPDENNTEANADVKPGGCCCSDPFVGLPPELRPKPAAKNDGLRKVTCPRCGLEYWTNRKTEVCMACEHKVG